MSKKEKKRLNMALHHLRKAHNLLGDVSLADDPFRFDARLVSYKLLGSVIASLSTP